MRIYNRYVSETRARKHVVLIRLNDEERETITGQAAEDGLTVSSWMRSASLKAAKKPAKKAKGAKKAKA